MLITIIILVAGITGGFVNYYAAKGDLFNKKGKPKKNGWIFLACIFAVVLLAVAQKFGQDYLDDKKELANEIISKKHDSNLEHRYDSSLLANTLTIKNNFDSGNDKQTLIISKTLGEYHLALDTANNRIVRLVRDSSKTRVIEPENPTLLIDSVRLFKKVLNDYIFHVAYRSRDATSRDFKLQSSLVIGDFNFTNLRFIFTSIPLDFTNFIDNNGTIIGTFQINTAETFSYLFVWLRGSYKNQDESKTFHISTIYYVGYPSGNNGTIKGATRQRIIDLVETQTKK